MRRKALALAILGCCAGSVLAASEPAPDQRGWRVKATASVVARADSGEPVDVLIRVRGAANLELIDPLLEFEARVTHVVERLQLAAERDHGALIRELERDGIEARSLWVANAVATRLTPAQLARIGARTDVVAVESDAPRRMAMPPLAPMAGAKSVNAIGPGVQQVRAPAAWALGYRGQGVVIAGQDTGYQWDHPALRASYRGSDGQNANHDYNWHDAIHGLLNSGNNRCGVNAQQPCDDGAHGTHTLGSVLGDDGAGNQIGVAPDARWIGCRNMDRGVGRPSTYIECYQFFLAPTDRAGNNPNPALAPHIITNSWGCPVGPPPGGEDCVLESFDTTLANVRAAGVLNVVAAGNEGPGCGTIYMPPAISADVLTVGAVDIADSIAGFSSWGPVTVDGSNRLKPDVVAPGVSIRSSIPPNAYATYNGTSMATPHVAGVAALVMSANPTLRGRPAEVERILRDTAVPLRTANACTPFTGGTVPNPVYGAGRVDALAAVNAALESDISSAYSGSWFDPARSGEGWILEILDNGTALLLWFTYPPGSAPGAQHWIIAQNGAVNGREIVFEESYVARGGRFGPSFDPAQIALDRWGRITMRFSDCDTGTVTYAGPSPYGSATRSVRRLTALAGLNCRSAEPRADGLAFAHSGAWFDAARSGEGWLVESIGNGLGLAYWFTYEPNGQLAWLIGVGAITDGRLRINDMLQPVGTRFGAGFDPGAVERRSWGSLEMNLTGCDRASFSFASNVPGYGSGSYSAQRLARIDGLSCTSSP